MGERKTKTCSTSDSFNAEISLTKSEILSIMCRVMKVLYEFKNENNF